MIFKDSPVSINGTTIFANEASLAEGSNSERKDELGSETIRTISASRPRGSFTANYYITDDDNAIRNLTGIIPVSAQIGEYGFSSGILTNYTISAKPNSLIMANLNIQFFSVINRNMTTPDIPDENARFVHGGKSIIQALSYNTGLYEFKLEFSQSVQPYFKLGSNEIIGFDFVNGQIKCDIKGSGLLDAISADSFCPDEQTISLSLRTLCNDVVGTINYGGLQINDAKLNLDSSNDAVGDVSLIKFF